MQIEKIHSFLTRPAKSLDPQPPIRGASVASNTKLFDMLIDVFEKSEKECTIDISFNSVDGKQENPTRTLLLSYAEKPTVPRGRAVAAVLQSVTTNRSGLGLLFLIVGRAKSRTRLLVSRFPADIGVLAEESGAELSVEFVEKVFMKNANAYKAALYDGTSLGTGYWDGKAIDKQINSSDVSVSDYWIRQFLKSDFRTTPQAGTRRLALAMRKAAKNSSDVLVKSQIASAAQLVQALPANNTSIADICNRFNFSEQTRAAIYDELPSAGLAKERFRFSSEEYAKHIQYRSMELDNGGRVVAEASKFDTVFSIDYAQDSDKVTLKTEGKIINEELRKSR